MSLLAVILEFHTIHHPSSAAHIGKPRMVLHLFGRGAERRGEIGSWGGYQEVRKALLIDNLNEFKKFIFSTPVPISRS